MNRRPFWKDESPTIDHGLLFGGCLKYRSMAALNF